MKRILLAAALATALVPATTTPAHAHDWRQRYSGNVLRVSFPGEGLHRMVLRDQAGDACLMRVRVDEGEGGKHTVHVLRDGGVRRMQVPSNAMRLRIGETCWYGEKSWQGFWRSV